MLVPFVIFLFMMQLCIDLESDRESEFTAVDVPSRIDESLSEPVKYEPTEATSTVNLKYHLNSGSIEPGIDLNKNLRMNLESGNIEFGTTLGNGLWMKF